MINSFILEMKILNFPLSPSESIGKSGKKEIVNMEMISNNAGPEIWELY